MTPSHWRSTPTAALFHRQHTASDGSTITSSAGYLRSITWADDSRPGHIWRGHLLEVATAYYIRGRSAPHRGTTWTVCDAEGTPTGEPHIDYADALADLVSRQR